MTIASDEPN